MVLLDKRHKNRGQKKENTVLWTGPYRVLRKISDIVYLIEREGGREDVVHVDRMKRFHSPHASSFPLTSRTSLSEVSDSSARATAATSTQREEEGTGFEDLDQPEGTEESRCTEDSDPVQPDEDVRALEEAENCFEVEALLECRPSQLLSRLGPPRMEYLVKWKNYPHDQNTWESRENLLEGAAQLVEAFDRAEGVRTRDARARSRAERNLDVEGGRDL